MTVDLHGPWIWDRSSGQIRTQPAEGRPHGAVVASVGNHRGFIEKGTIGPLLEAAPDMLEALEYILPYLRELDRAERHRNRNNPTGTPNAQICINTVRNAIAKATGAA